ncbi:DUF4350 domain-containing protein [Gemmatimonadota bacterium]
MAIPRSSASHRVGRMISCLILPGVTVIAACDQRTASTVEPARTVDTSFAPAIEDPAFEAGEGPLVCFDEAHNNFHTLNGTYIPFGLVLRADGYTLRPVRERLSSAALQPCRIFVIADAQPPARRGDPPTFSPEEIVALEAWVREGGSLFVITDHMPDPGAIEDLAEAFDIEVNNGYVLNGTRPEDQGPIVFRTDDGTSVPETPTTTQALTTADRIADDVVTRGRTPDEAVQVVATFAGAGFRASKSFRPLLLFGQGRKSWMPEEYWVFPEGTPTQDMSGWSQGGVGEYGEGRLAFFGEAAMFTAQVFSQGRVRAGMNAPEAEDNLQLLLNVMHWLAGVL